MLEEFRASKKEWLAWDKWSEQRPGLFKLEFEGTRGIALCSKCYFMEDENGKRRNCPQKGTLKRQNNLNWEQYKDALEGGLDTATNRGMRMNGGVMCTYEKKKLGHRAYYDK